MRPPVSLAWFVALAASFSAYSAELPLHFDEILSSVKERYPPLGSARKESEAAEGELRASEGAFDLQWRTRVVTNPLGFYENERVDSVLDKPTSLWGLSLFSGYRISRGKFALYDGKLETLSGGELRLGFELPLWRNGPIDRRRAQVARSKLQLTAAEAQVRQSYLESVRGAAHRYWDWVAAGRKMRIMRNLLDIAVDRDTGLRERVRRGDLPELERKDNERAILQRQGALIAARRALEQAALELSLFLRDGNSDPRLPSPERLPISLPEPAELGPFDPNEAARTALESRPETVRVSAAREQAVVETELAENQLAPRIDFQVAASRDMGQGDESRRPTEVEAGVLIEIPIERNLPLGRISAARASLGRAELQARFAKDRVIQEVRDSHSAFVAARERLSIVRNEVRLAEYLEKGERVRFQQGDSNILFVNLREQATADAAVREIDVLAECHRHYASLRAAIGSVD